MRTLKAAKTKRTTYTYHSVTGRSYEITPEEVDGEWISLLHEDDDVTIDADRRELYHTPIRYEAFMSADRESDYAADKIACTADDAPDPLTHIIEAIDAQEHEERLEKLKTAIKTLQPQQIALIHKVFYEKRTNVDIAAEEGVTEAAIRNRLKKIYASLRKKMEQPNQSQKG